LEQVDLEKIVEQKVVVLFKRRFPRRINCKQLFHGIKGSDPNKQINPIIINICQLTIIVNY